MLLKLCFFAVLYSYFALTHLAFILIAGFNKQRTLKVLEITSQHFPVPMCCSGDVKTTHHDNYHVPENAKTHLGFF